MCAIIKTLLFFSLGIFGIVYALKFKLANSFALSNWKITWDSEDPFLLDANAKDSDVTAVVDCGVAPGMSNIFVGHVHRLLDETYTVLI